MSTHLVIALSSHGYGHIGQTAPVFKALKAKLPDLRTTLLTAAPRFKLIERFGDSVEIQYAKLDVGTVQANAVDFLLEDSATAYRALHTDWKKKIAAEARRLEAMQPDLLLANVPYLPLAAASLATIPAIGYCSINWADIYAHYFRESRPEWRDIHAAILEAYNNATLFLRPEPAMPFAGINHVQSIGPVAEPVAVTREDVREALGLGGGQRLVMVSLGGMSLELSAKSWPHRENIRYVVPKEWGTKRPDMLPLEGLGMPFIKVLRGCDALVTKPGYGSFVEAAGLGIAVLYLERPGWPEVPYLVDWLERYGCCARLSRPTIHTGGLPGSLEALWSQPAAAPVPMTGIDEAVEALYMQLT